jgi:hypothetical protein
MKRIALLYQESKRANLKTALFLWQNTSARIATGGELIEVLKSTPIWNRMSAALQGKVEKI